MTISAWGGYGTNKKLQTELRKFTLTELQALLDRVMDVLVTALGTPAYFNAKATFDAILNELHVRARKEIQEGQHDNTGA